MRLDNLPTTDEIEADLARLVHELESALRARYPALERLPSVQRTLATSPRREDLTGTELQRRAQVRYSAIRALVEDVLALHPDAREQEALECLLTFDAPDRSLRDRQAAAAEIFGMTTGDSFRGSREAVVIRGFAGEICRYETWKALDVVEKFRDSQAMGTRWYRNVTRRWAVEIEATNPTEQRWTISELYEATTPVRQPVVAVFLPWSGTGDHDAESVNVLSGPEAGAFLGATVPHRLLAVLPDPHFSPYGWYFFHLGRGLVTGDRVELSFTQTLIDVADTFSPIISFFTRPASMIEEITLRAKVPDELVGRARGIAKPMRRYVVDDHYLSHGVSPRETAWTWSEMLRTTSRSRHGPSFPKCTMNSIGEIDD
ncbi:hypothetical protein LRS13_13825 [Svornostia abyssi]|uniref:Uncharacterized protein n=1 Tax=Svornostia abyssi TaxID=2898438 RepID=A0ABY5PAU6_9ACTN|nr:hypothetical protein LRS13_13825 [Parviterribacteraceae bacterium J379]